ncbi:MAG: hypothetical protein M3O77_05055, partial [Chloroflexota bacterium]|nr:hypothetical protein [Chloroflexota bacterium]
TPWLAWVGFVTAINLFLFVAIRGTWGRLVPILALVSLVGVVVGDAIGGRTGLELLRIGDFHPLTASIVSQLAMAATVLLGALAPARPGD